jgi:hypothetical protein
MKWLQNLAAIMYAKNPWGGRCTQRDTLQYECVHVVDSTGLGGSGRLYLGLYFHKSQEMSPSAKQL